MNRLQAIYRRTLPPLPLGFSSRTLTAATEDEAEAIANTDRRALDGRRILVGMVTVGGDDVRFDPPVAAVLRLAGPERHPHWNEDYLDPYWDVAIPGEEPGWVDGRSVRITP